ncbi:MAG: P-loop NTPase fold protein [Fibrobacterales bacterium]
MNREKLKVLLAKFLDKNSSEKVLLIKGDWGVGKSFFIEDFLEEWGNDPKNEEINNIGITSLFGVSEFKQCLGRIHFPIDSKNRLFKKGFLFLSNNVKKFLPSSIPTGLGVNFDIGNVLETLLGVMLKNGVLVIDDIERKNKDLPLSGVLGAATFLAEKKLRKIIIVFSEKDLNDDDKEAIQDLREKVVDLEYKFSPSSNENAQLFLKNPKKIDFIEQMEITNLRIIKKIEYAWKNLITGFSFGSNEIRSELITKVGVLSLIHLSDKIPFKVEDVLNQYEWISERKDQKIIKYRRMLSDLEYYFDERDIPIINFLANGSFVKDKWQASINSYFTDIQSEEFKTEYRQLWKNFNGNFKVDYETLIEKFVGFLDVNAEKLYPNQIEDIYRLFDNLEYDYTARKWLETSIQNNLEMLSDANVKKYLSQINDSEVTKLLEERLERESLKSDFVSSINRIIDNDQWYGEDSIIMQNSTVEDFKGWILNSEDINLLQKLRKAKGYLNAQNHNFGNAYNQLISAAEEISQIGSTEFDRKLNAERMKTFVLDD